MKIIGLILLVFLLALLQTTTKAQTASSTPVSKYYSSQVKEKLAAGKHPAPANPSQHLPSDNELPQKVKDLAKDAHVNNGQNAGRKMPGDAPVDINAIKSRNEKWLNKKNPA